MHLYDAANGPDATSKKFKSSLFMFLDGISEFVDDRSTKIVCSLFNSLTQNGSMMFKFKQSGGRPDQTVSIFNLLFDYKISKK